MTSTTRSRGRKPAAPQSPPADDAQVVAEPVPAKETALPGTNGNGSGRPPETFRIRFLLGQCWYGVVPLKPDPEVMTKCYRVSLLTVDGNAYDCGIKADGKPSCECLGFLNYGRPCRHLRMLRSAGMIDFPDPPASANGHTQAESPKSEPAGGEAEAGKEGP
jgi:hypothetical protein